MKKQLIDLSMLTPEEVKQLEDNPDVIARGDNDVCLYMRFSSERQTEQSIEGQLRDAISFCRLRRYRIKSIYVDRATSAAKDISKRVHFLQMIADSEKHLWDYVVVWKLDRFARSRSDSALYKMRLKRNGVRVVSVTENISDNPEGIILESVLEGMAEFYSAELSQKITRGMRESALKCNSVGGLIPLGYKLENKKLVIDPLTAPLVKRAFEEYAAGSTVADICREFNANGYRTSKGAEFNRNSFKSMFRNERYIGVYRYKNDVRIENGVPAIIDQDLFDKVQTRLKKNGEAPARGKAKVDYLLSGKLFCGHCGSTMNGESGTSKSGVKYHYYKCFDVKKHGNCQAKTIKKEIIESWVAEDAYEMLTDENIKLIADTAYQQNETDIAENTNLPALRDRHKTVMKSIDNIVGAIEKGVASDTLMLKLNDLESQRKGIEKQIGEEEKEIRPLDREHIIHWLMQFKNGDIENEDFRRQLIDLFVNSVTVWSEPDGDFKITIAYNLTNCKSKTYRVSECSDLKSQAPPLSAYPNTYESEIRTFAILGLICVQTKRHSLP